MVEKTPIHTTSTKCQYMLTASTATWFFALNCPRRARARMIVRPDRAAEDVRAVEAGQRVERRAEHAVGDAEAELAVVVQLAHQEQDAEHQRDAGPHLQLAGVAAPDGPHAELHREARGDEDDGQRAGQRDVQLVRALRRTPRSGRRGAGVEVGGEQAAEEHHLAGDEQQHAEQRRRHPRSTVLDGGRGLVLARGVCLHRSRAHTRGSSRRSTSPDLVSPSGSSSRSAGRAAAWPCPWVRKKSGRSEWIGGRRSKL